MSSSIQATGPADSDHWIGGASASPLDDMDIRYLDVMIPPKIGWIPCWTDPETEQLVYTGCVLPTQEEAEKVLEVWKSEGHNDRHFTIDTLPIYDTADEWLHDR